MSEVAAKKDSVFTEVKSCEQQIDFSISEVDAVISIFRNFSEEYDTSRFLAVETRDFRKKLKPLKLSISFPKMEYIEAKIDCFGKIQTEDHVVEVFAQLENLSGSVEEESAINRVQNPDRKEIVSVTDISDVCCPLCLQPVKDRRTFHHCGHSFCSKCIKGDFLEKRECPSCGKKYEFSTGNHSLVEMEENQNNKHTTLIFFNKKSTVNVMVIPYVAVIVLPQTHSGILAHKMLKEAYKRRLLFYNNGRDASVSNRVLENVMSQMPRSYMKYQLTDIMPLTQDKLDQVIEYLESQGVTEADV